MKNRHWVSHFLLAIALLLSGCYHYVPTSDAERAQSFQTHRSDTIEGQSLERYMRRRTVVLIGGSAPVSTARVKDNILAVNFEPSHNGFVAGSAHAAAIEHD